MTTANDNSLAAYSEHERLTATRMRWWGVFLIREQRRLQGIADRVRAQEAAKALGHASGDLQQDELNGAIDDLMPIQDEDSEQENESW